MKSVTPIIFAVFCLFFSGCGVIYRANSSELMKTTPPEAWGPIPTDYRATIEVMMETILIDPESARYSYQTPFRSTIQTERFSTQPVLVWMVPVMINAKNRFGGYTGAKFYEFAWSNGNLVAYGAYGESDFDSDLIVWIYLNK